MYAKKLSLFYFFRVNENFGIDGKKTKCECDTVCSLHLDQIWRFRDLLKRAYGKINRYYVNIQYLENFMVYKVCRRGPENGSLLVLALGFVGGLF